MPLSSRSCRPAAASAMSGSWRALPAMPSPPCSMITIGPTKYCTPPLAATCCVPNSRAVWKRCAAPPTAFGKKWRRASNANPCPRIRRLATGGKDSLRACWGALCLPWAKPTLKIGGPFPHEPLSSFRRINNAPHFSRLVRHRRISADHAGARPLLPPPLRAQHRRLFRLWPQRELVACRHFHGSYYLRRRHSLGGHRPGLFPGGSRELAVVELPGFRDDDRLPFCPP